MGISEYGMRREPVRQCACAKRRQSVRNVRRCTAF